MKQFTTMIGLVLGGSCLILFIILALAAILSNFGFLTH